MNLCDLTGQRFGRLVVARRSDRPYRGGTIWECVCDCGSVVHVYANHLKSGVTQSCGCLGRERRLASKQTHKEAGTRLYGVWACMKSRCYTHSNTSYERYGGRGIRVCDEWRNSYTDFRDWAMQNGYDPHAKRGACTLDRIDVNGNYEPNNCRWVSNSVQQMNKRPKAVSA